MNWRLKGLVQKGVSLMPGRTWLNRFLQLHCGGLRNPENEIDTKVVNDWLVFAEHLRSLRVSTRNLVVVEIGTGWYPTLPMCFALSGVARVETYDLTPHLDDGLTRLLVRRLEVHLARLAAGAGVTLEEIRDRYEALKQVRSVGEMLDRAGIRYHAPGNAAQTGLPGGSVDLVFSNSVLEHVTAEALGEIMRETARVLKPGGYSIHAVNCGDHYAYSDSSITQVNYLRFSDRQWWLWNNDLHYQNRLRAREFVRASEAAGLVTVFSHTRPKPELVAEVARMRLPDRFLAYTLEELAVTSIDFAGQRPPEAA